MKTQRFTIPSPDGFEKEITLAAEILRRGGLLAVPTETVYGLGANGLDEEAVLHIFEAKGRPQDNPLILHIPTADWLTRYCEDVPEEAYALAKRFWPGPLTMVLRKKDCVPLRTTGGLDSVGMRCPDHAVTRAIIAAADVPVAAPSANTSGRPSCTSADEVREDMDGKIDGIVDGGPCRIGVESTIVDLTISPPRLLRPGGLPLEAVREILPDILIDKAVSEQMKAGEKPRAPGMKYRHYAPKAPVTVLTGTPRATARYLLTHCKENSGVIVFSEFCRLFPARTVHDLGSYHSKLQQAQRVFSALRTFDQTKVQEIYAQCPDAQGLGLAVSNRLKKAAGFHEIAVPDDSIVFGITGGTGAGKTSVLTALQSLGACVLDCDAIYHEMLLQNTAMRRAMQDAFGDIFTKNGALNRQKLGKVVFGDPERLALLDEIVMRFLPMELAARIAKTNAPYIGIDAIKLIESGIGELCDVKIAVVAAEETRIARIMARDGISEEYARARVSSQKKASFFEKNCDVIFENQYPTLSDAETAAERFLRGVIKQIEEDKENGKE